MWKTDWTPLKADLSKGPIAAMYASFTAHGCPSTNTTKIPYERPGVACPGFWNAPLPPLMHAAYRRLYAKHKLTDYGWDKVVVNQQPAEQNA